jgi:phage protein U
MSDRTPILAPRPYSGYSEGHAATVDRRTDVRRRPWLLVTGSALGGGRFTAIHQVTGRSVRLDAGSAAQAQFQVELLNRRTLEISA